MATLTIENVDLDLLEHQRLDLNELELSIDLESEIGQYISALEGVVEMLNTWSDRRYQS